MEKMQYVNLGNTGLKVSRFSYGNWVNCSKDAQETSNKLFKPAFERGVIFFDTAEISVLVLGRRETDRHLAEGAARASERLRAHDEALLGQAGRQRERA